MRRGWIAILAALAIAAPALGGTGSPKPRLRLVDSAPVKVAGVGFHPRDRVTVTFTTDQVWRTKVRATALGKFAVVFADAHLDRCMGYAVLARAASGATAALKVMPLACAPSGRGPGG